jgi:hypothetical protein
MGKPKKVLTPGSYQGVSSKKKKVVSSKKKKPGRPVSTPTGTPKMKKKRDSAKYRHTYTEQDLIEAVRLVKEEGYSCSSACEVINDIKLNKVPRMTLNDRLHKETPSKRPTMGRPQE